MSNQQEQPIRAHQRRQDGVEYKLRVVPGSGGMLELVEQPPKPSGWFAEYARAMQMTTWIG